MKLSVIKDWTVSSQLGYMLKAYCYFPVTGIRRVLLGKDENLKEYFRNCWGILPRELLEQCAQRPVVWIEAQSMGEVGQLISLCRELKRKFPDHAFVLSTHDKASLTLARKCLPLSGSFYSPWDIPWVCRRVVRLLRPNLLLYVEHVKSPILLEESHRWGTQTILVSGFFPPGWENNSYLKRPVARRFWKFLDVAAVKEKEDFDTLTRFGMDPRFISIQGDLKFDANSMQVDEEKKQGLQREFALHGESLFVAGSVHSHEATFVVEAFLIARRSIASLKLILAPRWIEDVERIEAVLFKYPVKVTRRSALSSESASDEDVLILDTYGELASLYAISTVVFMGGSLPDGSRAWTGLCHNMIEPLLHQKPIFFGTNTSYRRKMVEQLKEVWPRLEVTTPEELGGGIVNLLQNPGLLAALESRERQMAVAQRGVVAGYVAFASEFLTKEENLEQNSWLEKKEPAEVNP